MPAGAHPYFWNFQFRENFPEKISAASTLSCRDVPSIDLRSGELVFEKISRMIRRRDTPAVQAWRGEGKGCLVKDL